MWSRLLPGTQNYFSFSANNNNGGTGGTSWSNSSTFTTDLNNSLPELSDVYGVSDISLIGAKFNAVLRAMVGMKIPQLLFIGVKKMLVQTSLRGAINSG